MTMQIFKDRALYLGDLLDEKKRLYIPIDAITESWAVLAKKGAGKTHTGHVLAEGFLAGDQQIAAIDPTGVWWGLRSGADGFSPGFPVVVVGGRHGDIPIEPTAGKVLADFVVDSGHSVVFDVSEFSKRKQAQFVTDFAERLFEKNSKPLHLFIDEADAFAPQKPYPEQMRMLGAVDEIVRRGRVKGLGVTLITQRSAVLNKDVLSQTEILVILKTTFPGDIKAIDEWIERNASIGDRKAFHETIQKLPRGQGWVWSPGALELFASVAIRQKITFDSSATPKVGETRLEPKGRAEIDLKALEAKIAASVDKATAENPETLRAEIRRLSAELRARPSATPAKIERVEVPVVDVAARQAVLASVEEARGLASHFVALAKKIDEGAAAIGAMASTLVASLTAHTLPTPAPRFAADVGDDASPATTDDRGPGLGELAVLAAVASQPNGHATKNAILAITGYRRSSRDTYLKRLKAQGFVEFEKDGPVQMTDSGMSRLVASGIPASPPKGKDLLARLAEGPRAILSAVAGRGRDGIGKKELLIVTGYKRSSLDTYIKDLRARSLVEIHPERGTVRLTEIADTMLAGAVEALPTGDQLRDYWYARLPEGESRVLSEVVAAHPKSIEREALDRILGYKRSSRDTYIKRLVSRHLVEIPEPGRVRASDTLFSAHYREA